LGGDWRKQGQKGQGLGSEGQGHPGSFRNFQIWQPDCVFGVLVKEKKSIKLSNKTRSWMILG